MVFRTVNPFEALMDFQRALDSVRLSDWFGTGTASWGGFPPINVFRQGDDFVRWRRYPEPTRAKSIFR